ncbi:MAG: hypothetical protein HFF36_04090 [Coprobacillus sp.]|nr:hypothetical protein [Coprobacillus sp.]
MYYLLLDDNLDVIERISTCELKKRIGKNIQHFLLYDGILNGYQVIEDEKPTTKISCKFVTESKRYKYYASYSGNFYAVLKSNNKKKKLKIYKHRGETVVSLDGKKYNVARILAKLFLDNFSSTQIVQIKDKKKKVTVDNICLIDRKEHFHNMNKKSVARYENNICVKKFNSIQEAANNYRCSNAEIINLIKRGEMIYI